MDQSTVAADIVEASSQPPPIFAGCPFWTELRALWKQFVDTPEYKQAVVILARYLADQAA